jgi:NTP pyrophosphatase (non-canonical NTP hydrolase)
MTDAPQRTIIGQSHAAIAIAGPRGIEIESYDHDEYPYAHGVPLARIAIPWHVIFQHAPVAAAAVHPVPMRPQVIAFASRMEEILRANDWKGTWREELPMYLSQKLTEEVAEVQTALIGQLKAGRNAWVEMPAEDRARIAKEAVDAANVCMMLADCLTTPPPHPVCLACDQDAADCGLSPSYCLEGEEKED